MSLDELKRPWPRHRVMPAEQWSPPPGVRIISTDEHIGEPVNLWRDRLPAAFRDRAPELFPTSGGGDIRMSIEGRDVVVRGVSEEMGNGLPGLWDLDIRLRHMDAERIDVSFMFGGRILALTGLADRELYFACIDAYNEWLLETCAPHKDRLIGVAVVPTMYQPEATADYIQKLKDMGCRAIQMPTYPRDVRYNSKAMEPMWATIAASGMPLQFHVGLQMQFKGKGAMLANITHNLSPFRPLLAQFMFSGILDRHPELKLVFTEGGATWAAQAIVDMDAIAKSYAYAMDGDLNPKLGMMPSEYWRRQCYVSFIEDLPAMRLLDIIGEDNVMWGSDYPHAEGTWCHSLETLEAHWNAIGPEAGAKLLGGNAARLWNL